MLKAALLLFALAGASLLVTGSVYLSNDQFMPYHADALQADWNELGQNHKGLILGLLKGLGSGAFITGSAVLYMVAASLRKSPRPYLILLPLVAVGYSSLLCYATFTVYTSTPGRPPLLLTGVLVAATTVASILLALAARNRHAG